MNPGDIANIGVFGSALVSFLGGTAFRLGITALLDRFKDYQEYKFELGRIELQSNLEQKKYLREIELLKAQKEAGIEFVSREVQNAGGISDLVNFSNAAASVRKPTGFRNLDIWNSSIRPTLATFCIIIWGISLAKKGFILGPWDLELIAATLGIFIGSRISSTGK